MADGTEKGSEYPTQRQTAEHGDDGGKCQARNEAVRFRRM